MVGQSFKQVHILVSGRVQGVFFRSRTKTEADKLGLTGWVRNLPDGGVEIKAAGDKENLEKLIAWCKKGPFFAKVEKVEVEWTKPSRIFDSFGIIY